MTDDDPLALIWLALMLLAAVWIWRPLVRRYGSHSNHGDGPERSQRRARDERS